MTQELTGLELRKAACEAVGWVPESNGRYYRWPATNACIPDIALPAIELQDKLTVSEARAERLEGALKEVLEAIKDSIANKLSMNNHKYDAVGQNVLKLLSQATALSTPKEGE